MLFVTVRTFLRCPLKQCHGFVTLAYAYFSFFSWNFLKGMTYWRWLRPPFVPFIWKKVRYFNVACNSVCTKHPIHTLKNKFFLSLNSISFFLLYLVCMFRVLLICMYILCATQKYIVKIFDKCNIYKLGFVFSPLPLINLWCQFYQSEYRITFIPRLYFKNLGGRTEKCRKCLFFNSLKNTNTEIVYENQKSASSMIWLCHKRIVTYIV